MSGQAVAKENPAARIMPGITPCAPWRVSALSVLPEYRLFVTFIDGKNGIIDCSAILTASNPGIYTQLAEPDYFGSVSLELGAPTWPNGADLDPSWLYDNIVEGKPWSVPF